MKKAILFVLMLIFIGSNVYSDITIEASKKAIELWFYTLLPSFLFPLIIVRLIFPYHLLSILLKPFHKIIEFLFHMDLYSFELVLSSLFLGFPSSSIHIEEHIQHLEKKQYERILYIPFMASTSFILLSLSTVYNQKSVQTLFFIQIITIFLLLFLTRKTHITLNIKKENIAFFEQISSSIQKSFHILFNILAYILIVYVIIDLICIPLPNFAKLVFKLTSEFASGCFYIASSAFPYKLKMMLTTLLLSYGGLCVHMQIISSLSNKFQYKSFLKYRIYHMCISTILAFLIC